MAKGINGFVKEVLQETTESIRKEYAPVVQSSIAYTSERLALKIGEGIDNAMPDEYKMTKEEREAWKKDLLKTKRPEIPKSADVQFKIRDIAGAIIENKLTEIMKNDIEHTKKKYGANINTPEALDALKAIVFGHMQVHTSKQELIERAKAATAKQLEIYIDARIQSHFSKLENAATSGLDHIQGQAIKKLDVIGNVSQKTEKFLSKFASMEEKDMIKKFSSKIEGVVDIAGGIDRQLKKVDNFMGKFGLDLGLSQATFPVFKHIQNNIIGKLSTHIAKSAQRQIVRIQKVMTVIKKINQKIEEVKKIVNQYVEGWKKKAQAFIQEKAKQIIGQVTSRLSSSLSKSIGGLI